ncbi:TPA: LysR family transcriptional regulator [Photobacterium damselae]
MDLNTVAIFAQVVECGSFTQAAEALELTKSTVSRKVAELESHLGVRLLTRSTRHITLTQEGELFYQSCAQMMDIISQAELEVTANQDQVRGRINIAMPVEVGQQVLIPYINEYLRQYPNVVIHLDLTNKPVDLISEGIDLYVQIGPIEDSSLIARQFHSSHRMLVASPEYLKQYGEINVPTDLKDPHYQIRIDNAARVNSAWQISQNEQEFHIELPHRIQVNTIAAAADACVDSLGIALLPEFICLPHLETGRLVHLLPEWKMPEVPISLVYSQRNLMPKRLRLLIDFLMSKMEERHKLGSR